jgi:hypothetical protein
VQSFSGARNKAEANGRGNKLGTSIREREIGLVFFGTLVRQSRSSLSEMFLERKTRIAWLKQGGGTP